MSQSDRTPSRAAHLPLATYRLQMNRFFTFRDAARRVPYLHTLGVSDLYASPYLQARPKSLHGYDIIDHNALNAEVGPTEDYREMTSELRERGMGHLLDIVPNHMGIGGGANRWWMDVLENGPSSEYAAFFDIDWNPIQPERAGKVLLPVLGDQFGEVLERGEIEIRYLDGHFRIEYFDHRFPAAPKSTAVVLRSALDRFSERAPERHDERMELESIVTALEHLPPRHRTDPASVAERRREKVVTERRLAALHRSSPEFRTALDETLEAFNGYPGDPRSFDQMEALLADQAYRLAYWRVAAEEINYRRFFDINELAGVRVEVPRVFEETHRLILRLFEEGTVTGLRIDHPDGLYDPAGYLQQLRAEGEERTGRPPYVLVEKILTGDEELPADWPIAGTVGYEFLNTLNGLFVAGENEAAMHRVYNRFVERTPDFDELTYARKKQILRSALASELNVLSYLLYRLSEQSRRSRDFTLGSLTDVLRETIACFPVYRTYIDAHEGHITERDRYYVERAIRLAKRRNRATSVSVFNYLRDTLLLRWSGELEEEQRREHARFVMKFQQLTGPVMAKGVEDTSFYIYNRLVSLNEVGGEPDHFGVPPRDFHERIGRRAEMWPYAMNTTSTHDTKRSEDVRARINVLSEIPDLWEEHVLRWAEWNAEKKEVDEGTPIPDSNDEYLLYQTLVGAWPLGEQDASGHAEFVERIQGYMEKATREAKTHTSWINPNEEYDLGLREFVGRVLDRDSSREFLDDLQQLQPVVSRIGMMNALAQTLLKLTVPGVPDLYQGQELWDFSLVDPDNRRPVDYDLRERLLEELQGSDDRQRLARELVESWTDGRIKLWITHQALMLRRSHAELFHDGGYHPMTSAGTHAEHVVAFSRRHDGDVIIVAVPRLVATLTRKHDFALPTAEMWSDTSLQIGDEMEGRYRNVFTGREETFTGGTAAARLFDGFPVALWERMV